jgi:hypothetical protein
MHPAQITPYNGASRFTLSPDGRILVVTRDDQGWLFEAGLPRTIRPFTPDKTNPLLALSNGGAWSARLGDPYTVSIVETQTGRSQSSLRHPSSIAFVAFSPDSKTLAVDCGEVFLWEIEHGLELSRLPRPPGNCLGLQFSPNGRSLAVLTASGHRPHVPQPEGSETPTAHLATVTVTILHGAP